MTCCNDRCCLNLLFYHTHSLFASFLPPHLRFAFVFFVLPFSLFSPVLPPFLSSRWDQQTTFPHLWSSNGIPVTKGWHTLKLSVRARGALLYGIRFSNHGGNGGMARWAKKGFSPFRLGVPVETSEYTTTTTTTTSGGGKAKVFSSLTVSKAGMVHDGSEYTCLASLYATSPALLPPHATDTTNKTDQTVYTGGRSGEEHAALWAVGRSTVRVSVFAAPAVSPQLEYTTAADGSSLSLQCDAMQPEGHGAAFKYQYVSPINLRNGLFVMKWFNCLSMVLVYDFSRMGVPQRLIIQPLPLIKPPILVNLISLFSL